MIGNAAWSLSGGRGAGFLCQLPGVVTGRRQRRLLSWTLTMVREEINQGAFVVMDTSLRGNECNDRASDGATRGGLIILSVSIYNNKMAGVMILDFRGIRCWQLGIVSYLAIKSAAGWEVSLIGFSNWSRIQGEWSRLEWTNTYTFSLFIAQWKLNWQDQFPSPGQAVGVIHRCNELQIKKTGCSIIFIWWGCQIVSYTMKPTLKNGQ